jgi:hypothetical protein
MLNFIRGVTRPGLAWVLVLAVIAFMAISFMRDPAAAIPDRFWTLVEAGVFFYLGARTAETKTA